MNTLDFTFLIPENEIDKQYKHITKGMEVI